MEMNKGPVYLSVNWFVAQTNVIPVCSVESRDPIIRISADSHAFLALEGKFHRSSWLNQ